MAFSLQSSEVRFSRLSMYSFLRIRDAVALSLFRIARRMRFIFFVSSAVR